ncbi:hypothetical protein C8J56DRAFT_1050444 [Mycena floridula]|nr:hypothetical protein C8J56DRAFT_1050444 [Mycena floridula]
MKSFSVLLLILPAVLAASINFNARDDPTPTTEIQDGQTGTLIVIPPQATETSGIKQIPDADHSFIAPGPDDQRGREFLSQPSTITLLILCSFSMPHLTRGNPFVNKISIGGVSPLVPPLPGKIDGPETAGIAKHGRVEGDASMTRADAFIGDNRNFQEALFDEDLAQLAKFGDDGPDGEHTVFNLQTIIAMKTQNIMSDQAANPKFEFAARRMNAAYGAGSFILTLFANGTTKQATLPIISSFFRNQTFPQNWFRPTSLYVGSINGPVVAQISSALGIAPGRNNEQDIYVADPSPPAPFNVSLGCFAYWDQARNIPGVLMNTTGIFKKNVDLLTGTNCQEE